MYHGGVVQYPLFRADIAPLGGLNLKSASSRSKVQKEEVKRVFVHQNKERGAFRVMGDSHFHSSQPLRPNREKDVENMQVEQLVDVFKDTHSSRMEVCKAAERIVNEKQHLSEGVTLHPLPQS